MIARLLEHGVQMINPEPRLSADGKKYAFVHPKSAGGVLVELYELPPPNSPPSVTPTERSSLLAGWELLRREATPSLQ